MTLEEMVTETAERLNLTSQKALDRIKRTINIRYRQAATSVGMQNIVRGGIAVNTVIASQGITVPNVEKIYAVFDLRTTPYTILQQISVDSMLHRNIGVDPPTAFCVTNFTTTGVTISLDIIPASVYAMGIDADVVLTALSADSDVPLFPASFHDLLIFGAMATELDKMEKYEFAKKQEAMYQIRLADLRYYIAKSRYLDIHQGKSAPTNVLTLMV